MKRFPILLGLLFVTVTIRRVAHFAGGDALAWTFSVALAISVYVSAYLTGWKITRRAAWVSLLFFAGADGFFNLAETLNWSLRVGRWATSIVLWGETSIHIYRLADVLYGAFPTLAAAILGWLAMYSEKLIAQGRGNFWKRALHSLEVWLFDGSEADASEPKAKASGLACKICGYQARNQNALNAHQRVHSNGRAAESEIKQEQETT